MENQNPLLNYRDWFKTELDSLGLDLSDDQINLLLEYLQLVLERNKVINLTSITDAQDAIILHLIDSLLLVKTFKDSNYKAESFLDIGTGAGFPGAPFGISTNIKGTLLDSTLKKINCIKEFVKELDIEEQFNPIQKRAEDLALDCKTYDLVVARAVAQSNILIEYAAPLQKQNGILMLTKANITNQELETAQKAAEICGYSYVSRETYELPLNKGHREILLFKKIKKEKIKLPRKNGVAKQSPLGLK